MNNKTRAENIQRVCFVIYVVLILWVTVLDRQPGSSRIFRPQLFYGFREWIAGQPWGQHDTNMYLENVVLFIPFGFLFPQKKNWKYVLFIALFFSVLIECTQYLAILGDCEIDDVSANAIGAIVGFWLFKIGYNFYEDNGKVRNVKTKKETGSDPEGKEK